jgi:hypothetical protein
MNGLWAAAAGALNARDGLVDSVMNRLAKALV